jgi:hypothetical protein
MRVADLWPVWANTMKPCQKKKKMKKKKKNIMDGNWKFPSEFGESLDVNRVFTTYEIFK